jgi:hypothetical protein
MEFVKQARQLAGHGRKKKGPQPRLGGGKMLPPLNPTEPNPVELPSALNTKRERHPLAAKVDPVMYEMKYPRSQRKNKFLAADADFPINLSKSLNGPLREPLKRKGFTRSVSDLRHSIDEQMISMRKVNDMDFTVTTTAMNGKGRISFTDSISKMGEHSNSEILSVKSEGLSSNLSLRPPMIRVPTSESIAGVSTGVGEHLLALNSGRRPSK